MSASFAISSIDCGVGCVAIVAVFLGALLLAKRKRDQHRSEYLELHERRIEKDIAASGPYPLRLHLVAEGIVIAASVAGPFSRLLAISDQVR